jgi:hypothetical protein
MQQWLLSYVDFHRGDTTALIEHLRRAVPSSFKVQRLAQHGLLQEAETAYQSTIGAPVPVSPVCNASNVMIMRGALALGRNQTAEAVRLLEAGVNARQGIPACMLRGSETLARALQQQGDWQRALAVLEDTEHERVAIYATFWSGLVGGRWLQLQRHRAELLRKLGREPEALEIEAELRRLLIYADADHDIVRYLNRHTPNESG